MDQLEDFGLIDHHKTKPGDRGWQSSMLPTLELLELVHSVVAGNQLQLAPLSEPILLRDPEKNLVDYRETRLTDRMRRELRAQNEALMSMAFGPALPFPGRLRRIFNGDFDRGGRFYAEGGSWQTLPKAERQRLNINGEPTVEIDFSSFHPTLAYAECGLSPPVGAYEVSGWPRDLVKVAFNLLLNSSGRNGARHELANKRLMAKTLGAEWKDDDDLYSFRTRLQQSDPSYFQRASRAADELIEALLSKHDAIRTMFFSGAGLRLQRGDSDIAESVMRRMRSHGIVVLPVHDSFIVQASMADLLEQAMIEETAKRGVVVECQRSSIVSAA